MYRSPDYFISKFVFRVQWSLDFKKNYYIHFYLGSCVKIKSHQNWIKK